MEILGVVVAVASLALPGSIDLVWKAPAADCPDAEAIQRAIQQNLPPEPRASVNLRVSGAVSQIDGEIWRAQLKLHGPDWQATRVLEGPTCAAVSDAASLVITLAINTESQAMVAREAPPPPAAPPPPPAPRPEGGPFVAVGLAADAGGLPQPAPGLGAALGWRIRWARIDVGASAFSRQDGTVPGSPAAGAGFTLAAAQLRACYQRVWRRLSLGPCAAGGIDRTRGVGFGPIQPGEATSLAVVATGGILATWALSRHVVPFLSVEGAIPLLRPQFSVKDVGPVHRAAPVLLRGAAGVELRFR
jgi:hypothetical protein